MQPDQVCVLSHVEGAATRQDLVDAGFAAPTWEEVAGVSARMRAGLSRQRLECAKKRDEGVHQHPHPGHGHRGFKLVQRTLSGGLG